jgi:hypothetical protein
MDLQLERCHKIMSWCERVLEKLLREKHDRYTSATIRSVIHGLRRRSVKAHEISLPPKEDQKIE